MGANQAVAMQEDESLDALLADLSLTDDVEDAQPKSVEAANDVVIEPEHEEVIADLEMSPYDGPLIAPKQPEADIPKAKPEKKAKAPKVAKEPKAPKVPKEPKEAKPKVERKYYANKMERITDKLGADFENYMLLEKGDLLLSADEQSVKKAETMATIMGSGSKVQNRQTFIIEFVAGKSAKLNKVISLALHLTKTAGFVSTGAEGNYLGVLKDEGYSLNAAKAMGGNSLLALKTLKVLKEDGKGRFIANHDSIILEKLTALGAY